MKQWSYSNPPGMMFLRRLLLAGVSFAGFLIVALPSTTAAQHPTSISLCDVFSDLRLRAGRIVVIHGTVVAGAEVFAMTAPHCLNRFAENKLIWPPAIWLTTPALSSSLSNKAERRSSVDDFLWKLGDVRRGRRVGHVTTQATIVGELRLKNKYSPASIRGRPVDGFGHLGAYPAELVILDVLKFAEPTFESKPRRLDSGEAEELKEHKK